MSHLIDCFCNLKRGIIPQCKKAFHEKSQNGENRHNEKLSFNCSPKRRVSYSHSRKILISLTNEKFH